MLASHVFPDAGIGTNVILLIGLAVGVDYTLQAVRPTRPPRTGPGRLTTAVLRPVGKHPAAVLTGTVLVMLALAAPVLGLNLTDMGRETHSRSIVAMRTYDRLNAAFPS